MRRYILIFATLMLIISGCGDQTLQEGEASWYGPGFHGQLTSSGETYDENDLTAAHRTLPFNTIVRVINTDNDKTAEVRINDRGPYEDDRIIDLSRSAAEEIDMIDSGVAEVRLELVEAGGPIPRDLDQEIYTIQVGEYNAPPFAQKLADEIGGEARVEYIYFFNRNRYMVYYSRYTSIADAQQELQSLKERGYDGFVKQIN